MQSDYNFLKPKTAGVNSISIPKNIKIGWKALLEFQARAIALIHEKE